MINSYLKISFRMLMKHKGFSAINIFGFGVGISICLIIIIFIKDQKDSDRFHENNDRIVRVYTTDKEIQFAEVSGYATTPGSLAPHLLDNYPFIEDAVRLRQVRAGIIFKGTEVLLGGLYAEPSFFNIFSFPLKEGNPNTALDKPYSIILSEETALKFFGEDDPINKILTFEKLGDFTVTGVLKNIEEKSHFKFDALFSFSTVTSLENKGVLNADLNSWSSFKSYYTYILLNKKSDCSLLKMYLPEITTAIFPELENERYGFELQPLSEINLGLNLWCSMPGTIKSLELIFIPFLAVLIISVACFNYIILSIAHSLKRTKEIGLHKVIGARRGQIIKLFLSETFMLTAFALLVACLFILWLIPIFNGLDIIKNNKLQINIEQLKEPGIYIIFILFTSGISVLAGLFPALYLSSFKPVNALKRASRVKGLSHLWIRKILIGIQFAICLIFIIFIIYFKQLHTYLTNLDYGIETETLVNVYLGDVNYEIFRNEIRRNSDIRAVSLSNEIPVIGGQGTFNLKTDRMEKPRPTFYYSIDPEFIHNFGIELIAGRNFSHDFSTDKERGIIINQEAVRIFDLGSPTEAIGKILTTGDDLEMTVIGIVKNFIFYFPDEPITALVLRYRPEEFRFVNINFVPGKKEEMKSYLKLTWKKFDQIHEVNYEFFDDAQQELNSQMDGIIGIFSWTCGFVILIALFGLFGMANYTLEMRVKEIGIRKVLGASVSSMVYLLSKDYIKLILYSAVFAIPTSFLFSDMLYQFFAFRPNLNLWVLPASLIFILILALMTVGSQTVKAAIANPTETLKEE